MYELVVTIESTNPNPEFLRERAMRELELIFGEAVKFVSFKPTQKGE